MKRLALALVLALFIVGVVPIQAGANICNDTGQVPGSRCRPADGSEPPADCGTYGDGEWIVILKHLLSVIW